MKKKILAGSIVIISMLVSVSIVSSIEFNEEENKESPIFRIRAKNFIRDNIKTGFLRGRIFQISMSNNAENQDLNLNDHIRNHLINKKDRIFYIPSFLVRTCKCYTSDSAQCTSDPIWCTMGTYCQ